MIRFVHPKINIGLNITGVLPNGYHTLQTIFYPLHSRTLCDILEVVPAEEDNLTTLGDDVGCPLEKNLVWKALQAFRSAYKTEQRYHIILQKNLPSQAGMGGGSADATATLRMLNELNGSPLSLEQMHSLALGIGADCPYFLYDTPCYASGIGDILTPIELDLSEYKIVVVKPPQSISTAEAFRYAQPHDMLPDLPEAVRNPIEEWKDVVTNDFENSIFTLHPRLQQLKQALYDTGALYASMTGSGSAFYAIYPKTSIPSSLCAELTSYGQVFIDL